jgi:tungstate transport system substrate-binding protein
MKKFEFLKALLIVFSIIFVFTNTFANTKSLLLATTTSVDNTGLLNYLAPKFKKDTGLELKWVAVGSGEALQLGKNCDADALLVHDPIMERRYVKSGYGIKRTKIMYNDFVIIGPKNDPAKIKNKSVINALQSIAAEQSIFVSRGDNSGTYEKEKQLWQIAKIHLPQKSTWHIQSGQGMMATIYMAAEKHGYTLTDRGTFIKYAANHSYPSLIILVQNDKILFNQYSLILVDPKRCKNINTKSAEQFRNWLIAKPTQTTIANYKLLDKRLFIPNADEK